jgi:hypothetical protein
MKALRQDMKKITITKGKVHNINRHSWCTYEKFERIYNFYDAIMEGKVAINRGFYIIPMENKFRIWLVLVDYQRVIKGFS